MLKKAMVFTLAASMLVGTPLTASAAGIRGVYSVSDGETTISQNGIDDTATGTVTNTNTNTGVLSENETKIVGFVLDQESVKTEVGANPKPVLKATVILDGTTDAEMVEQINSLIRWKTSDSSKVSIDVKASDRTEATLNPKKSTGDGKEVVITASIGGNYPFTYKYKDKETGEEKTKVIEGSEVYREATATVFVKEYARDLWFEKDGKRTDTFVGEADGILVKHTVDMKQWLQKDPATANDEITWSISKTSAATISNEGVVTLKKYDGKKEANNTFTVTAVSEKGAKATATLTVAAGTPASKVEIREMVNGEETVVRGTKAVDVGGANPCEGIDVYAVMFAKKDTSVKRNEELEDEAWYTPAGEGQEPTQLKITDEITWSVGKSKVEIIELRNIDGASATVVPKNVGTAKITATATSGKKASFNVKVSATLTGLVVDVYPGTAWSGQTHTLKEARTPDANKDALTWSVWKSEDGTANADKSKDVTINNKGVLKVKNTLSANEVTVWVQVESKKARITSPRVQIVLNQSSIDNIWVQDITNGKPGETITNVVPKGNSFATDPAYKNAKTNIRIPVNGVYQAIVTGDNNIGDNESLSWTISNSKVAELVPAEDGDGVVTIVPKAKGTTKITVSGINVTKKDDNGIAKTAKVIKTQFTVNVIQPTTSIKLNKTDIVLYPKTGSNQKQSVSLKATMNPKGAADDVNWTVLDKDGKPVAASVLTDKTKASGKNNVNYKVEFAAPALGDVYTVRATSVTGVSTTATIKVLQKPTSVEIHKADGSHEKFSEPKANGNGTIANTKYVEIGKTFDMQPEINVDSARNPKWILAGTDNTEGVTYTQSGAGKVIIIGNKVYGVKEGKVTITAKTPNNKKTTLKVEVKPAE